MSEDSAEVAELKRREMAAEDILREARLAREKVEKAERAASLEPLKALAVLAHDTCCAWNHTDGCGWGYEMSGGQHVWDGSEHQRWLVHVKSLIDGAPGSRYYGDAPKPGVPREALEDILNALAALRAKHRDALYLIRQRIPIGLGY